MTLPSRHSLNIMSDPRIYRGSVIARQREEATRVTREAEQRHAEKRYRIEVVRTQLNMALNDKASIPSSSYSRSKPTVMTGATMNRITRGAIRTETSMRLAKLAGKTGRIAITEWIEENGIDISPRAKPIVRCLSPISDPTTPKGSILTTKHSVNGAKRGLSTVEWIEGQHQESDNEIMQSRTTLKFGQNFKNVAFVPLKEGVSPGRNDGPHKVVPAISSSLQYVQRLPPQRRFMPQITFTPPQSPYGPIVHSNAAVQTDETFDITFDPIIKELATDAITNALKNLRETHEFKMMEAQTKKLLNIVVAEKRKNNELNLTILEHIKTEHELDKDRHKAWNQLLALDCRRMASEFIEEIIKKCTENLANRGLIEDTSKVRSVAADTRQLERYQKDLEMVTLEIKRDFFPYVYAKAEQIFVHKLANSYLCDALFSKEVKHRAKARQHLNEQLQKYQKMTEGCSLRNVNLI